MPVLAARVIAKVSVLAFVTTSDRSFSAIQSKGRFGALFYRRSAFLRRGYPAIKTISHAMS
jgi:hypothetical protein